MKTRTKCFLAAPLVAALVAAIASGQPAFLTSVAILYGCAWLAWRAFLFVMALTQPVRDKLRPIVDPINQNASAAMRRAGLGAAVDASERMHSRLDSAIASEQESLDRHKK